MTIANLYRRLKKILNDTNNALINKGLFAVETFNKIPGEIEKLGEINRLPYLISREIIAITKDDFGDYDMSRGINLRDCNKLVHLDLPAIYLDENCKFSGCTNLQSVTIFTKENYEPIISAKEASNNSTHTPWSKAVGGNIRSIIIEEGVVTIGDYAFYNSVINAITIPNSVTHIGRLAFGNCFRLTSVSIPASVISIDTYAFNGCSELVDVYVHSMIPPTLGTSSFPVTTIIHVPIGSGDAYRNATNWSYYSPIIVEDIVL
jgi:hypothetical protein